MFTLRPYQQDLIDRTRQAMQVGSRAPLLVSPCGSGKTVMFSYFARSVAGRGKRCYILAHREELVDQISETLREFEVPHSFIAAGRLYDRRHLVQVASVFTLAHRLTRIPAPDFLILDEAHHAAAGSTWDRIIMAYGSAWRVGVTATPERLSGEPLRHTFDCLILGPDARTLIDQGALCDYRLYVPSTIDTSNLHMRAGDYVTKELAAAADKPTITGDAIREYKRLADGKRAIVFCVSIEHSQHVASSFRDAGYQAASLNGKMDRAIRRQAVQDFRSGKLRIITSCDLISEGFDLPAIECAIMLRPTQSLALWIQQSGRALRPSPGKPYAVILDHAGNCLKHGLPDEERPWSLDGHAATRQNDSAVSVRLCGKCFAAQPIGATSCRYCGFVFEVKPRKVEEVDGDLVEIDAARISIQRRREQGMASSREDLLALAKQRGYRNPHGWVHMIMQARQGRKLAGVR